MKTISPFFSALNNTSVGWLRRFTLIAVLAVAEMAHAQGISGLPTSITVYSNQTVTAAFTLDGWSGSNVVVTVGGAATNLLSLYSVTPSTSTVTNRSLSITGGTVGGPSGLTLTAAETPTAVHTVNSGAINVTVLQQPTVAYSTTNGFHGGHIDQDSTSATLTVTKNSVATNMWGSHSNTVLFPGSNIFASASNVFPLIPNPGKSGSDTFTVYVTDLAGGWTNSISITLNVAPILSVKGWASTLDFDEDTRGTNSFSVSYSGETNQLVYSATFSPTNLIQSHTFRSVGGISTNLALEFVPYPNANGETTCKLVVTDGLHAKTNNCTITVNPVPDPTSISGVPAEIYLSNKAPWTNVFTSVTLSDPDDDRPIKEKLDVYVRDSLLQIVFANSAASEVSKLNTNISDQNDWIRAITLKAADNLFGVIGTTNDIPVVVIASSDNDHIAVTNTMIVHLHFQNTAPEYVVNIVPGQGEMYELETRTPFTLSSITDPDDSQTSFTLSLHLAAGYEQYGSLSKNTGTAIPPEGGVIGTGNRADIDSLLRNTQFTATEGVLLVNQTPLYFVFSLYDGFDTTIKTNTIMLRQLRRPPVINLGNGAPKDIFITSAAPTAKPYSKVYVTDPDEAGNQPVRAAISISPNIGSIDVSSMTSMQNLQTPAALSDLLRAAIFTPNPSALDGVAVGQSITARLTLTVTDETGLSDSDNEVVIHIERVNAAPVLTVPEEQPVLFTPGTVIRPFADVTLSSDDTNAVTFAFSIDDPAKGAFGNVDSSATGFASQGPGSYQIITANIGHILSLVTNITFTPSSSYPFPPDDPYGTLFTLSAKDYQLLTTTRTLAIQVQAPPRNWLVTKQVNDGTPGTFQHALEHFSNNDVITFALPSYPATIRMSASRPVIETGQTLTIKGPGADLLTISGDSDGNGTPDRQILAINSPVTIEGLTLAHATAPVGGALAILSANGKLLLRNVVIRDSVATQYGGAIDVYGGALAADSCAFLRNSVTDEGYGGGAISTYTDYDIGITNTLFDSNAQLSLNGAGGAIFAELIEDSLDDFAEVELVHCTFVGNVDESLDYTASSVYACSGTHILPLNTLFADDPLTRTLNLDSGAAVWSMGGNICDDSTYVPIQQQLQNGTYSNYLLDSTKDRLSTDSCLAPLDSVSSIIPYRLPQTNSPAIGFAPALSSPATVLDQRTRLRVPRLNGTGVSGAIDPAAVSWPVITEIQLSGEGTDTDRFIELFAPRKGQNVNLAGYTLFVNGVAVHEFGRGNLALTNNVYKTLASSATVPASYILAPGRGVVVVFPKGATADFTGFSPLNPTPVVRGSIVTNATEFAKHLSSKGRGSVAVAKTETDSPIVRQTFLTVFNDPDSIAGTGRLDTAHNSIAPAPQSRGFAFLPHSSVSVEPFNGWRGRPATTSGAVLLQSPGATVDGAPFGLPNATPLAIVDAAQLTEDDVGLFDVLSNDYDADNNDRLVIVDVSPVSASGSGNVASTNSALGATVSILPSANPLRGTAISYDPRQAALFQALPVGVEILDTFYYEIIDIGSAAVDEISGGTSSNTWVTSANHRLATSNLVTLSGVSVAAYNGTFEVTVIDADTFAIPVPFTVAATEPGSWEAALPRVPTARSEAAVTVRVTGVNDAPTVGADVVTNVTESANVRIMVRPEFANMPLSLPSDPVPAPTPNPASLMANDSDVDTDETWQTLRLIGVMPAVHAIQNFTGTPGDSSVTVHAPAHGLASGTEVLIANYGGHPSYNGYHTVTVVDADTFTIPCFFVDNHALKGVWVVLNESNRYHIVTDAGATVDLTLRADPREDHLLYNASVSAFLNTLSEGDLFTNRFYQAVVDRHGAIGIGPIDIVVVGLNDKPVAPPDPAGLTVLEPLVSPSNTLENVLASGLDILYTLPPASKTAGRIDVQALDLSSTLSGTLVLSDLWTTDEDTLIAIATSDLLVNDSDVDRHDSLSVSAAEAFSREGAAVTLAGVHIQYNPTASAALQALARDERVIDTFSVTVTDGRTGGSVTSLVSVLVIGLNDKPVAKPDALTLFEDERESFNPITRPEGTPALHDYDLDINGTLPDDLLTVLAVSNLLTIGEARVHLQPWLATYDAAVSEKLNQLADWQEFSDTFNYTISDNSFLFVMDDTFYVPADTVGRMLDVLANDRDFTPFASKLTIVDVGPTLRGGTVSIAPDGQSLRYDSPVGEACDDYFRYVVENEAGNRRSARVLVRSVTPPLNGILGVADDHFVVAYGETAVLDVRANDNTLPLSGAGLSLLTNIWSSSVAGQPVISNNLFVFTATNGMAPLTFTYGVTAGGTSVAYGDVIVDIIDRRGTLHVKNDTFSVQPGSVSNELAVLSNDAIVTGSTDALSIASLLDPALYGTVSVDASARKLVYTPNNGFLGVETLRYLATDRIGGTGTGVVTIVVGKIDTVIDFFTVEAKTNDLGITLDVLANDRIQPFGTNALTLVSVSPASTGIGTLSVSGSGKHLVFMPSNTVGQADFVYLVSDSTARMATGSVTIATVPPGVYANTDRFMVRGGGSAYTLDVLANDRSYPEGGGKSNVLISVGAGAEAPSAGGSVIVVSNRLSYTPVPSFIGQESFTYTMSDGVTTDSAWVTVTVMPGDLFANADDYTIYFEHESGSTTARTFTLPVTLNDRIQPALGQSVQITGLGVGTNAPDHAGLVSISSDGLSLLYTPTETPATLYVERFMYEISDGAARRASGQVVIRVMDRANTLGALVQDDAFTVLRNSTNNELPLLRNDSALPGTAAGWVITTNSATAHGGVTTISGASVLYTPPANFVGIDTFTYAVNDGLGGTGSATVRIQVGAMPTLPDLFVALSGSTSNDFDVVANDVLFDAYADEYVLLDVFGATQGGMVTLSPSNTVLYAPASAYAGPYPYTETFFYTVRDDAAGVVTGITQVVVHQLGSDQSTTAVSVRVLGRNDIPVLLNTPPNPTITDKETTKPFTGVTLIEVDQQTLEPITVTVTLDNAVKGVLQDLGGFVSLGNGVYRLVGATAAAATTNLHNLLYVPVENRITVPTTESARFTLEITDNKSAPVTDTQTVIRVTAVNDAPVIAGTRSGQTVYAAMPIRLFSSVTITEVDDLTLQHLTVTVQLSNPANGVLQNLGSFASLGGGAYRATGLTAAQATEQLRALEFLCGAGRVAANQPQLTVFTLTVEDGFAPPVVDSQTSVKAYSPSEGTLHPTNSVMRSTFGFSVDTCMDFAVAGAPGANVNGPNAGFAMVYRLVPGTTNTWQEWRQLQPATVDAYDQFGYSVSINNDLIAIGAIEDEVGSTPIGVVYLFGRNQGGADNWGLMRRLTPTNLPSGSRFGFSVDLNGDLLAVGAPKATLSSSTPAEGAVLLFGRNVGGADAWGEIMRWEPRGQTSTEFGASVAIDTNRLVVGSPQNKTGTLATAPKGAVFCFGRDTGGAGAWGLSQTIRLGAVTNADSFGYSLALKGTLLAVGSPTAQVAGGIAETGVVYLFATGAGGAFVQTNRLDAAADGEAHFGQSVSMSSDFLFVGAPGPWGTTGTGSAYLYRRTVTNSTAWQLVERLMNPVPATYEHFGSSVSLCQNIGIVGTGGRIFDRYTLNDSAFMYRFKFNNAPAVMTPIADQLAEWGEPFSYTVPNGVFADPDFFDVLTVQPVLPTTGHGLTVSGMTVAGTPTVLENIPVEVRAMDASGASAMEPFAVVVRVNGALLPNTPRNIWNVLHFGKDAGNPALESTLWGGAANADGDATDNDTEYAFGGDPNAADASALLTLTDAPGGNLLLTYVCRRNDPALTFTLQGSPTLSPPVWGDVVAWTVSEQRIPLSTEYERVEVTISVPLAGPEMFFRVLVTP